jgi:GntR family transcriptional regulator
MNGRVPRYHRIAEALRERIRTGALAPGSRLDNQRRLAASFGVTLMTLRQALQTLEREKLITRRHGLGTFVASPAIDYDILQLRRFAGDLVAQGEPVLTRLLGGRIMVPDAAVAGALAVAPRARVVEVERLRLVDGFPTALQRSFLPLALGEEVLRMDLARLSLREVLEFKLGVSIRRAHETVAAVRLGRREARELACGAGDAAFQSERVSYDAAGQPVVFDRVFIPGQRFRITRELHYTEEGPHDLDAGAGAPGRDGRGPSPRGASA